MSKIKIAITGGIGSGKTTVCKIIASLGYNIYSTDEISREILNNASVIKEIKTKFSLDNFSRKELANIVFSNKENVAWLNNLTHPLIMERLNEYLIKDNSQIVFVEVPLLFESDLVNSFDKTIIVYRNLKDRILSVIKRDNLLEEEVLKRINNQVNYENLLKSEHTIIYNDFDIDNLKSSIIKVINAYKKENNIR